MSEERNIKVNVAASERVYYQKEVMMTQREWDDFQKMMDSEKEYEREGCMDVFDRMLDATRSDDFEIDAEATEAKQ
jgi:hypothetical protein